MAKKRCYLWEESADGGVGEGNVMMSFLFTVELHKCAACLGNIPSSNIYLW